MKKNLLSSADIIENEKNYIAKTFNRYPVVWDRGEGCRLWDRDGKNYLDFFSGHGTMNLGYSQVRQFDAMRTQLENLVHAGNLYYTEKQVLLAKNLVEKSFGDRVFFSNSGAEIVELAIKLVRKWAKADT